MNPEHKKYILENINKKSIKELALDLAIKERKIRKFVEAEKHRKKLADFKKEAKTPARPVKKTTVLLSIVLIIILGLALYANSLNGKFIYDDENLIVNNAFIKNWSILPKIFSEDVGKGAGKETAFYRPIQMVTYAIDYSVWKLNVVGYHFTNILLHVLVALAVYWLINILFNDKTISVLTALLFVVHPIHTTVVRSISTRAESLYLLFLLVSFIFYIKSLKSNSVFCYLVMISSYLLSLLSKENALIFPVLLLLYHYTFKEKVRMKEFLSVSGAALLYIFFRMTALKHLMAGVAPNNTLSQRIPGFFAAVVTYIRLLILPLGLHSEYGNPQFNFTDPKAIAGLVILAALIFYIFKTIKTNRLIFFCLSWFLITLLPVSNLYPLNAYMSENWLYLPSIGFFLIIAGFLSMLYKKEKFRILALIFTSCLLVFYSYLTFRQNQTWADPISFYERTLKYAPGSSRMYNNLGAIYYKTGRKEDAIAMYKKAIEINPNYGDAYNNLASTYYETGRKEDAIPMYKKAIELNPNNAEAYNNLGLAYYKTGRKEDATAMYKKAMELNPNNAEIHNNLGIVYYETGKKEDAIAMYKKAIELNPDIVEIYNNLGAAYFELGKREEAISAFKKALEINPDYADARRNLEAISGGSK